MYASFGDNPGLVRVSWVLFSPVMHNQILYPLTVHQPRTARGPEIGPISKYIHLIFLIYGVFN